MECFKICSYPNISLQKCRFLIANVTPLIWFTLLRFMDILVSIVFVLSECIHFTKVCTLVYWLRGMPQPTLGCCHLWHPQTYIIPMWECGHAPEQALLAVNTCDLVRGPGTLHCDTIHRNKHDWRNLWLLKQDLLSTVKNNYGSNLNPINKSIILSWFGFLHIEGIKMQSHSHWSHGKCLATEVNWSKIKFTLFTFFILQK